MRLIILGAGGYGRTIEDIAGQSGKYDSIRFLDDKAENPSVIGKLDQYSEYVDRETEFYPAIGRNEIRHSWIVKLINVGAAVASIIHSSAYVSPTVHMGNGVAILPGAIVGTNTVIGDGAIINCGAIVDHDVLLENGVHVAPGAVIKGGNVIKEFSKIESGTVVETGQYPRQVNN